MGLTRHEVNLRRLLAKCELLCKNDQKDDERFPKYIDTLEDMLQDLKKSSEVSKEATTGYQKRILAVKAALGITSSKYIDETDEEAMRKDLLGVRQRTAFKSEGKELDQVLNYHEEMQKKITDEMLTFTKSLKEQSELANKIIKKDTEIVSKSTDMTDQNYSKLMVESGKLAEHSKRAWKCWMWIMLVVVIIIFINMVLFMKVMKKSK